MTLSKDLNASSIPSPVPPHTYKKGKEKTSGNELHCTEETTSLLRFKEETPPEKNACSAKVSLAAKNKTIPIATDRRHKPYEQIQNKKGLQEMEPRRKKCTDVTQKRQRITKGRVEKSTFDCPAIRQSLAAPDESTTRPRNAKQATSGREKKTTFDSVILLRRQLLLVRCYWSRGRRRSGNAAAVGSRLCGCWGGKRVRLVLLDDVDDAAVCVVGSPRLPSEGGVTLAFCYVFGRCTASGSDRLTRGSA